MKLTIRAASPQNIVDQIAELARRNADIVDGTANTTHLVREKDILHQRAQQLRTFGALISDATVELPVPAINLRAAQLLDEVVGLIGGEEPEALSSDEHGALIKVAMLQEELRAGVPAKPETGNSLAIDMYLHCGMCIAEVKQIAADAGSASPRDHARLSIGWTKQGLQVWCVRHDCNVMHVDFEGCQHPADLTRKERP